MSRQTWVRVSSEAWTFDEQYWKELKAYYSLPWYKRLFKKPPKTRNN